MSRTLRFAMVPLVIAALMSVAAAAQSRSVKALQDKSRNMNSTANQGSARDWSSRVCAYAESPGQEMQP